MRAAVNRDQVAGHAGGAESLLKSERLPVGDGLIGVAVKKQERREAGVNMVDR